MDLKTIRLFNCDNLYSLEIVKNLLDEVKNDLPFKLQIESHYFRIPEMRSFSKEVKDMAMDYAVFVVHADESRLSINEKDAGIGYACVFKELVEKTGGKVLVVIGGDSHYERGEESKSVISQWARYKISSQFNSQSMDGTKSFVFSWKNKYNRIHNHAVKHFFEDKGIKFDASKFSEDIDHARRDSNLKHGTPSTSNVPAPQNYAPLNIKSTDDFASPTTPVPAHQMTSSAKSESTTDFASQTTPGPTHQMFSSAKSDSTADFASPITQGSAHQMTSSAKSESPSKKQTEPMQKEISIIFQGILKNGILTETIIPTEQPDAAVLSYIRQYFHAVKKAMLVVFWKSKDVQVRRVITLLSKPTLRCDNKMWHDNVFFGFLYEGDFVFAKDVGKYENIGDFVKIEEEIQKTVCEKFVYVEATDGHITTKIHLTCEAYTVTRKQGLLDCIASSIELESLRFDNIKYPKEIHFVGVIDHSEVTAESSDERPPKKEMKEVRKMVADRWGLLLYFTNERSGEENILFFTDGAKHRQSEPARDWHQEHVNFSI